MWDLLANARYKKIMEIITSRGYITISEIVRKFYISAETARRDLLYLESLNFVKRVHGGAVAVSEMKVFKKLKERLDESREQKQKLSRTAAGKICENDIIAIDSGSTAFEFVNVLKENFTSLKIVTHSAVVFEQLKDKAGFEIILIGGQYMLAENVFYGDIAVETINKMHFPKAFIFPSAVSLKSGVGDYIVEIVAIQKAYINNSDNVFILADSTKFEKNAFYKVCDIGGPYTFITDDELDDGIYNLYRKNNIRIIR